MKPYFKSPTNFELKELPALVGGVVVYQVLVDPVPPSFVCANGDEVVLQPDPSSDLGSIPSIFQMFKIFRRDRFLLQFLFHDLGYMHAGLWFRAGSAVVFRSMARAAIDSLCLYDMIAAAGDNIAARVIYEAVRCFGGCSWAGDRAKQKVMAA